MGTVQITIEESLLAEVQQATKALQMTRSDFFKLALERALRQRKIIELEIRDAHGPWRPLSDCTKLHHGSLKTRG